MTDREALEYIRKGLTVNRFSPKWQRALELACNALEEMMLNTSEKPVRTGCDERKEDNRAKILSERLKALNGRFFDLEQAVEKLSVDLNILRDRFDSHIWERHDED